jgi:hypothetical protein
VKKAKPPKVVKHFTLRPVFFVVILLAESEVGLFLMIFTASNMRGGFTLLKDHEHLGNGILRMTLSQPRLID